MTVCRHKHQWVAALVHPANAAPATMCIVIDGTSLRLSAALVLYMFKLVWSIHKALPSRCARQNNQSFSALLDVAFRFQFRFQMRPTTS